MSELTFDTLQYAKKLKSAGFTEEQAEIQAEAIKELIDDRLATKSDIKQLRHEIREMSYKLTIRMGGMLVTAIIVLTAIIKL